MKLRLPLFVSALLFPALSLFAATFVVTSTDDSGSGTLRKASVDANGVPAANAIHFNLHGTGVQTIGFRSPRSRT